MRNNQLLHALTEVVILWGFYRPWQGREPEVDYNLPSKEFMHLPFTSMHWEYCTHIPQKMLHTNDLPKDQPTKKCSAWPLNLADAFILRYGVKKLKSPFARLPAI